MKKAVRAMLYCIPVRWRSLFIPATLALPTAHAISAASCAPINTDSLLERSMKDTRYMAARHGITRQSALRRIRRVSASSYAGRSSSGLSVWQLVKLRRFFVHGVVVRDVGRRNQSHLRVQGRSGRRCTTLYGGQLKSRCSRVGLAPRRRIFLLHISNPLKQCS